MTRRGWRISSALHDVFTVDWAIWLRSAEIDNVDPQRGPTVLSARSSATWGSAGKAIRFGLC